jgi:hypothetical protein
MKRTELGSLVLDKRLAKRESSMKKAKATSGDDDLRPEYDVTKLKGGVRGKYLKKYRAGSNLALLAPDVRSAFPTDEAVNEALRSLMHSHQAARMKDR